MSQPKILSTIRSITAVLFFLILCLPWLQNQFQLFTYKQLNENRNRLTKPNHSLFEGLLKDQKGYTKAYEAYFNDTYGLRDFFIQSKNQIDYSVFGISNKVLINKDNYLFNKEFAAKYRSEIDAASESHYNALYEKIANLSKFLNNKGITLVIIPVPLADYVYPEHYPHYPYNKLHPTGFEKFQAFLAQRPDIGLVNVQESLTKYRNIYKLYYKTDFHYTTVGSYLTVQETLTTLSRFYQPGPPHSYPLIVTEGSAFEGILDNYLATFSPPKENAPVVMQTWPNCAKQQDSTNQTSAHWINNCHDVIPRFPKTVIFGNSFMTLFPNMGFPDHFEELHSYLLPDLKDQLFKIDNDTRFVIIQMYEIDLWNFLYGDTIPTL